MKTKKVLMFAAAMSAISTASAASIGNVVVNQMWPWSTKVAIDYELTCDPGETWDVSLTVKDAQNNDVTGLSNAISGDTDNVSGGARRLVWDPGRSLATGDAPVLNYTLSLSQPLGKKYMIVDLSAGRDEGGMFSVSYLDEPPSGGFNTTEYKTTKMVFRRCRAGSFIMGSPETEVGRNKYYKSNADRNSNTESSLTGLETQHKVTLTKDFYLGIFEVTGGQAYFLWDEENSDSGITFALRNVLPTKYRQPSAGASYSKVKWAASTDVEADSFVGKFRAKIPAAQQISGYVFDLPTEAQWEYACRAGTTNTWNNDGPASPVAAYNSSNDYVGDFADTELDLLGTYLYFPSTHKPRTQSTQTGSYLPNAWGFYDMHGNVREICLDSWPTTEDGTVSDGSDVTDPVVGQNVAGARIARGGCWNYKAPHCRSASKNRLPVQTADNYTGIRLALVPERPAGE